MIREFNTMINVFSSRRGKGVDSHEMKRRGVEISIGCASMNMTEG